MHTESLRMDGEAHESGAAVSRLGSGAYRRLPALIVIVLLVLASRALAEQPGVDIATTTREPQASATLAYGRDVAAPYRDQGPVFFGPTAKTRGGEYGLSLWAAPNPPLVAARTASNESGGWLVLGFTITWGGSHP